LLAGALPAYRDHLICLVGTGLRAGELLGLRAHRVDLAARRLEVVEVRYEAGRFGRGYKDRPKSPASIRVVPLAAQVVDAIARQLPDGCPPSTLVFAGPGGGNGVPAGARTRLTRDNLRRAYQTALVRVADPTALLAYTRGGCCGRCKKPALARPLKRSAAGCPAAASPSALSTTRSGSWRWPAWRPGRTPATASHPAGRQRPLLEMTASTTCSYAALTTCGTPSRPGWRTPASPPG